MAHASGAVADAPNRALSPSSGALFGAHVAPWSRVTPPGFGTKLSPIVVAKGLVHVGNSMYMFSGVFRVWLIVYVLGYGVLECRSGFRV